jgi:hypothetical protein
VAGEAAKLGRNVYLNLFPAVEDGPTACVFKDRVSGIQGGGSRRIVCPDGNPLRENRRQDAGSSLFGGGAEAAGCQKDRDKAAPEATKRSPAVQISGE